MQSESARRNAFLTAESASLEPPHDCSEDGHSWRFLGEAKDGTRFYKCRHCGVEDEQ